MNDASSGTDFGWTRAQTQRRQSEAGLRMTAAERLEWLEDTLDELIPLVGRARQVEMEGRAEGESADSANP